MMLYNFPVKVRPFWLEDKMCIIFNSFINKHITSILNRGSMPILLGNSELKNAVAPGGFIQKGKIENVDGIKYDFSLSQRVLKAKFKQPINIEELPQTTRTEFVVEPGEVVFVLTEEFLQMPDNVMAILIPKRKLSHDGIMILGGLSVDPLYSGKLLIGLYNLSSSPFPIIAGKKLIAAQFYKLSDEEKKGIVAPAITIKDFPEELIKLMQNYKPVSVEAMMSNMSALELKFENLLQEFRSKDDWFEKLQSSMDRHEKNIDKILDGLQKEVDDRRQSDDTIKNELKEYAKSSYKTAAIVGTLGALLISLILFLIQYFFQKN